MSQPTGPLRIQLHRDISMVYKLGLDPAVEPTALPGLSALAKFLSPRPYDTRSRYYGDVIKDLLTRGLDATAWRLTTLLDLGQEQLNEGLLELFGIGEHRILRQLGERRNRAGPLLGYPKGDDTLRHAAKNNTKLTDIIMQELTDVLVMVAEESNFEYEPPPELKGAGTPLESAQSRQQWIDGERALTSSLIGRALFRELEALRGQGFESAAALPRATPTLVGLAHHATHSRTDRSEYSAGDLEAILVWASDQMPDPDHAVGTREAIGLGDSKGLSFSERCDRAAPYFRYKSGQAFRHSHQEARIAHVLRNQLVRLAAEVGYWERPDDPPAAP